MKKGKYNDILQRIKAVCEADDSLNFAELVEISGLDPSKDFRDSDWNDVDLSDCNLSSYDFSGSNFQRVNVTRAVLSRANLSNIRSSGTDFSVSDLDEIEEKTDIEHLSLYKMEENIRRNLSLLRFSWLCGVSKKTLIGFLNGKQTKYAAFKRIIAGLVAIFGPSLFLQKPILRVIGEKILKEYSRKSVSTLNEADILSRCKKFGEKYEKHFKNTLSFKTQEFFLTDTVENENPEFRKVLQFSIGQIHYVEENYDSLHQDFNLIYGGANLLLSILFSPSELHGMYERLLRRAHNIGLQEINLIDTRDFAIELVEVR